MKIKRGSTSVRRLIFVADSSSATGAGLASVAHNAANLVAYYFAGDLNNEAEITLASATLGSYTSGGWVAVDNTNMPGWYEVGIPDAALDGGNEVAIQYRGAANMVPVNIYIELDAVDYQSATNFGLSKFGDIETDTQDIQSRLPAALVSGRIDASVGAMAANTLTASALATDAVDEIVDAVFAYQVTQDQFLLLLQNMYATVNAIEVDTQNIQSRLPSVLVSGRIDASVGAMAANTLTASALATDAVDEIAIQSAQEVFSYEVEGIDNFNVMFAQAYEAIDRIELDTQDIQSRLPSALVSGRMNASVGAMAANTITASALATDAVTEIQAGLATSTGVTSAFSEIKGAGWSSSTDTLEDIRDAAGTGGGGTIIQTPIVGIVPERDSQTLLRVYRGETVEQEVTVFEGDGETPIDLSGKTLEIVFEAYLTEDVVVIADADIDVSGDDNNVVTFDYPATLTATTSKRFWSLREATSPYTVYLNGEVHILRAAVEDP